MFLVSESRYITDIEYAGATQDGTEGNDYANTAVTTINGTFVLAGSTYGDWNGSNAGNSDFAAVKLDADGNVIWKWQVSKATSKTLTKRKTSENVCLSGARNEWRCFGCSVASFSLRSALLLHIEWIHLFTPIGFRAPPEYRVNGSLLRECLPVQCMG